MDDWLLIWVPRPHVLYIFYTIAFGLCIGVVNNVRIVSWYTILYIKLASTAGIEPTPRVLEALVLPLHHVPINARAWTGLLYLLTRLHVRLSTASFYLEYSYNLYPERRLAFHLAYWYCYLILYPTEECNYRDNHDSH